METTNFTETNNQSSKIQVAEWNSYFFPYVKYVGYMPSMWGRNGRELLSLGRTPEEAIMLSRNKLSKEGIWRVSEYIKSQLT